jgi:hypothetical protein
MQSRSDVSTNYASLFRNGWRASYAASSETSFVYSHQDARKAIRKYTPAKKRLEISETRAATKGSSTNGNTH